jgi:hypothetical protein
LGEVVDFTLVEAKCLEVGYGELGESLLVKGRFEPLEREGAVGGKRVSDLLLNSGGGSFLTIAEYRYQ